MENMVDDITEWEKSYISIKMNLTKHEVLQCNYLNILQQTILN